MEVFNVLRAELEDEWGPEGYRRRMIRLGERLGARLIGATLYEVPPGQRAWPYHYEYGNEEWLLCLAGRPTLRTPEGERELGPGAVVAFADGPAGAHQVVNRGTEPARLLMVSTKNVPAVGVYPDSGKVAMLAGEERAILPRDAGVDYWDGE